MYNRPHHLQRRYYNPYRPLTDTQAYSKVAATAKNRPSAQTKTALEETVCKLKIFWIYMKPSLNTHGLIWSKHTMPTSWLLLQTYQLSFTTFKYHK